MTNDLTFKFYSVCVYYGQARRSRTGIRSFQTNFYFEVTTGDLKPSWVHTSHQRSLTVK